MDDLKKLYALLAILIVIYVGINFAYNGLDTINSLTHVNLDVGLSMPDENDENSIRIANSSFSKIKGFQEKRDNADIVTLYNSSNNISIKVVKIKDSYNLKDIVNQVLKVNDNITSNQTITQNGITAYFLYEEKADSYNAIIYFNKEDKNYLIKSNNISYDNSDYFINICKDIINSMKTSGGLNYSRF